MNYVFFKYVITVSGSGVKFRCDEGRNQSTCRCRVVVRRTGAGEIFAYRMLMRIRYWAGYACDIHIRYN